MAEAASAHKAATATHPETSQQGADRTRRTSADLRRAQQGATAAAPAALNSLSRLQQLTDASPQVAQLRRLQALADGRFAPVAQLAGGPEEEELIQGKFASAELPPQLQQAPRANNTGLPDQLKSGIESLSGLSMDHVRVHYNSLQPAQLNALAFAQGSDIHLGPGQEHHLPHEAWHVVQQKQGRVKPTMQMKEKVNVNDDAGLEKEADVMGAKASKKSATGHGNSTTQKMTIHNPNEQPIQKVVEGPDPVTDSNITDQVNVNDLLYGLAKYRGVTMDRMNEQAGPKRTVDEYNAAVGLDVNLMHLLPASVSIYVVRKALENPSPWSIPGTQVQYPDEQAINGNRAGALSNEQKWMTFLVRDKHNIGLWDLGNTYRPVIVRIFGRSILGRAC